MIPDRGRLARDRVQQAVSQANLPTLLMVLYQLTADDRWLRDPFRPTRGKGMSDNDSGGFSQSDQEMIREQAVTAIVAWSEGQEVALPSPDQQTLVQMLGCCMGENVPQEYGEMIAEEPGLKGPQAQPRDSTGRMRPEFSAIIVGAGVSGLMAGLELKRAGITYTILEKNPDVGGTWFENRYPGCGVDTPSHLYSFSFFPRRWSSHYGKRDELAEYMRDMASTFHLTSDIRFQTEVLSACYDEAGQCWTVTARGYDGAVEELSTNMLITAVGQLNRPKVPLVPGMERFSKPLFHSSRWPSDLDISGKRVGVIGTGASAMQIVPAIVDQVSRLTVVQRSPQWVAPSENYFKPVTSEVNWLLENVPFYHAWYRLRLAWINNDRIHASLQIDPDWPHPERAVNAINDGHRRFFTEYIVSQLGDREDLLAKALPTYPPFGKRMLLDNGWFASLKRPHVDLLTGSVEEVTENGFRTTAGTEVEVDIVVFATGFQAQRLLHPLDIRGRNGITLRDVWGEDDASAYLGLTVPGFPNMFVMYGPNTNLGHGGSYMFFAERQARYIRDLAVKMGEQSIGSVECRKDVHDDYNRRVDEAHSKMIWSHRGMDTWYRNERGRVVTNSPWRIVDYWRMTRDAELDDFVCEPVVGKVTSRCGREPGHGPGVG
ncbi:monooxygenase [Nocardioides sp. S5]|uniref:flavin-containing monooxygenase n=1 Tax=Nocardioides sp. S5 TaxID=2017486 RepID=UPI001AF686E6|nr:NAD(P)/FAD-dependent oxidoreductase [Nocardioides sp. S5]QSR32213.1 monooxygenase [Nocardioides sp. S5]